MEAYLGLMKRIFDLYETWLRSEIILKTYILVTAQTVKERVQGLQGLLDNIEQAKMIAVSWTNYVIHMDNDTIKAQESFSNQYFDIL